MSLRNLPALDCIAARDNVEFDPPASALARWNAELRADTGEASIDIYDVIGPGWDGEGVTAKKVSAALARIGDGKAVTVNINSPGGSVFEGIAIYNLLRAHKGEVTVRVVGLAASAASVIAMAGDRIQMGEASFLMVHNVWLMAIGNRHDLRQVADTIEPFDDALAAVYASRTGIDKAEIAQLMDAETWMNTEDAIDRGFADESMPNDKLQKTDDAANLQRDRVVLHNALAKAGLSRSRRRELIRNLAGMPSAAGNAMPGAGDPGPGTSPAAEPQTLPKGDTMNLEQLRAQHPELAQALVDEGYAKGKAEGASEGAAAERQRIQDVEAQAMPGHEQLIAELKFDGKTSGAEAALQVVAAEKAKNGAALAQIKADAPDPAAPSAPVQPAAADESLPIEERAKREFESKAEIRAEFGELTRYVAYRKAEERRAGK